MKSFLEYVAEDLISKYGTNLSNIAVVFPNKRAALFVKQLRRNTIPIFILRVSFSYPGVLLPVPFKKRLMLLSGQRKDLL